MSQVIKPEKYTSPSTYVGFLNRQNAILSKAFRNNVQLKEQGTTPDLPSQEHAYYVALIHSSDINSKVTDFSRQVASRVPALMYDPTNIHTTLANGYITRGEFTADPQKLDKLIDLLSGLRSKKVPRLVYHAWLPNQTTTIAAAYADQAFFELALSIHEETRNRGLDLNFPWGSHISASRFTERRSPDQLEELFSFVEEAEPLGESKPVKIAVGIAETTPTSFTLEEHGSIFL